MIGASQENADGIKRRITGMRLALNNACVGPPTFLGFPLSNLPRKHLETILAYKSLRETETMNEAPVALGKGGARRSA